MERIVLIPLERADCDAHGWPTDGLAVRIIIAMRREGGINVCSECLTRAHGDAHRRIRARS
jgi:hypothetical protein